MPTANIAIRRLAEFARLFSAQPVRSAAKYEGMAAMKPEKLDISSTYKMNSGYEIPVLGYGVYQTPADVTESVTLHAFRTGYRHVDSARVYRNEQPCADAIRASGLLRSEIFFTSKVPPRDMGYERTKKAIATSFSQTKLDYIDLYLVHAPYGGADARCGTWRALREAQVAGQIRSIGVSNYGVHHLDELAAYIASSGLGGAIDVGQWELHPWLPRRDIVAWCRAHNVVAEAYCPLVRGQRATEAVLGTLAGKHSRTWAQVLVRWSLQMGFVPLPKSVTPSRIEENADVYGFELDEADMALLNGKDEDKERYEPCSWDPTTSKD